MSFTDTLKRSLGFEESESVDEKANAGYNISELFRNLTKTNNSSSQQQQKPQQPQYKPKSNPVHTPSYPRQQNNVYNDYVITPEQSFYEIVLIRPKSLDDVNYVVDQVIEEKNPVIIDLSFLEKESPANFKLAGEKIKQMRGRYGAQALLLSRTEDKNLIIVSPSKVNIINKG